MSFLFVGWYMKKRKNSRIPLQTGVQIVQLHFQKGAQRPAGADIVDGSGEFAPLEVGGGGDDLDGGSHRGRVRCVGGDAEGMAAAVVNLGDERLEALWFASEEDDGVGFCEAFCYLFGRQDVSEWREGKGWC